MTTKRAPNIPAAVWRRRSDRVLTSDVVAGKHSGPAAPPDWASSLRALSDLSRSPVPAPSWWTPKTAYFGNLETRTDPSSYHWDGMKRLGRQDMPLFFVQFTLAGFGHYQRYGQEPRRITPGMGFFAVIPSRHRYYLPADSPGWTFGWIGIYHPFLLARITKRVAERGPFLDLPPDGILTAKLLRLVRGAIKKDFRDALDVETALFDFVFGYERWAADVDAQNQDEHRLLDEVRGHILAALPKTLDVTALARTYGMTRSHFSHHFRKATGMTPARFSTEVRIHQSARMLHDVRAPLKQIAESCGFANLSHFCRLFRRFQHLSPAAYRSAVTTPRPV